MTNKTPEELYRQGREVLAELAPMVTQHGMGQKFAELVDLVDMLKPKEAPQEPLVPVALKGKYARSAFMVLQLRFKKAVGINVFDTQSEDLVRATWALVNAVIADKNEELEDLYRDSGIQDTPDWDVVTELRDRTEVPEDLGALLWGVKPKAAETRKGR